MHLRLKIRVENTQPTKKRRIDMHLKCFKFKDFFGSVGNRPNITLITAKNILWPFLRFKN